MSLKKITIFLLFLALALLNACASADKAPVKPPTDKTNSTSLSLLNGDEAALFAAAANGDLKKVQELAGQGVNLNAKDGTGRTALTEAVANGHASVVKFLLDKGADANTRKKDGTTAISLAGDNSEVKELLKKAGAKEYKPELLEALLVASGKGDLAQVKELVQQGADINGQTADGRTSIIDAVYSGHAEVVKYLLENGADPNARKKDGATAISFATDKKEIKELLKKAGAKENNPEMVDKLVIAASKGDLAKVKELVQQGIDINSQTADGRTALIDATYNGQTEVVKYLLDNKADPNLKKQDGATALSFSTKYPALKEILVKAGARQ